MQSVYVHMHNVILFFGCNRLYVIESIQYDPISQNVKTQLVLQVIAHSSKSYSNLFRKENTQNLTNKATKQSFFFQL